MPNPELRAVRRAVRHHLMLMASGAESFDVTRIDAMLDEVVRATREGDSGAQWLRRQRDWFREECGRLEAELATLRDRIDAAATRDERQRGSRAGVDELRRGDG